MAKNKWTSQEISMLKKLFPIATWQELIKAFPDKTRNAINKKARELGLSRPITKVSSEIKQDITVHKLRSEKTQTAKKYKELMAENEGLIKELEALQKIQKIKPLSYYRVKNTNKINEAVAVILVSDWHYEEYVDPTVVNSLNHFTLEIADQRIAKFWHNGLKLIKIHQRDNDINTLVLALLGDFISGNIHEELLEGNQLLPMDAILAVQDRIVGGINMLLKETDLNLVIPCHAGNHSRITARNRIATEYGNSLEYFMYRNMAWHFKDNPRINFLVSKAYHSYVDVFPNFKIRFHHGHQIVYKGGIGGVYIPANKAIAQWNKSINVQLDCFGHYHQKKDGGNFILNGSLVGYDPFAISIKADFENPKQTFFLVDARYGKTIVAPIHLM